MFSVFASLVAAAALSASGSGAEFSQAKDSLTKPTSTKMLYVCERDAVSKRTFKRLHGEVKFVTARSVLVSRDDGDQWNAPRCITGAELRRLKALSNDLIYMDGRTR